MVRCISAGLVLVALLSPAAGLAQQSASDEEARALFDAGRVAYSNGRYDEALQYFQKAYDLSKRAPLLYNIATTLDRLRRDEEALRNFEEFVKQVPNSDYVPAARERIDFLRAAIAARQQKAQTPAATPAPAAGAPTPAETALAGAAPATQPAAAPPPQTGPVDQGEGDQSVTKKWWFWTAVGVVAAGAIVGIALAASSGGSKAAAPLPFDGNTRDVRL